MVQSYYNPRDSHFDPFTYLMFGAQMPPAQPSQPMQPPQTFYQNGTWQASGTPIPPMQNAHQPLPSQPGFLKPFLGQDGHIDLTKMVNGASQLVNVINQTAPAIKQLSPLLNFFKKP
ncbi:YppG family protein [Sporolactobacillus sp. CPB3-1]|uniref:YppG family protein n=1 Tax=Sporolactobacillus mangiferae TaxID=2940498 RepID=A0ABT0M870_9BACL|nr:YppG family protein [Sporolactobacillus mangiferae]MCL1631051.1 YppG family protein [Sporolactobacillus mangiferae]